MGITAAGSLAKKLADAEKIAEEDVAILTERIALLYYAFVKGMIEELGEERAIEITKAAIGEYGAITGREAERRVREQKLAPVIENYAKGKDLPSRGWKSGPLEPVEKNQNQPAGNAHRVDYCPFASAWKKLGFERFGRLYCGVDQAKYAAYGRGYKCVHEKNLCDGDDCCVIRVEDAGLLPE